MLLCHAFALPVYANQPTLSCRKMTRASFAADLRAAAAGLWEAQHAHPFVRGVGDGTLPLDRFAHYVRQDYVFLAEYARMLALGAARAPDLATMRRFADLAQAILGEEMELHRATARELGISEAELEAEPPAPTTQAYTDFLVRTAAIGELADLSAALLPCMWGYAEVGQRLAAAGAPADDRYARWIAAYAAPEFEELAAWCRALVDRLATTAGEEGRARMTRAFLTCSRYELAFWEMGWTLERWPTDPG
jgi:thiaminase/transcriptional activator TenA